MNKKMRELLQQINAKKQEARSLLNEGKKEEAKKLTEEIRALQEEFDIEATLFEEERASIEINETTNEEVDHVRTFFKALRGEALTEEERALIVDGANNENLIIPEDVNTQINELRRSYKSARSLIGYYPTTTLTGSFVYEDASTITELTNFTDGDDVPDSNEPKFVPVQYEVA